MDCLGGCASTINGITYRNHFDTFNDPAKFGLFYHAALLFRRGDVKRGEKRVAVQISEDMPSWLQKRPGDIPALALVSEQHRVGLVLPGQECDADLVVPPDRPVVDTESGEVRSDTGQLWRSWSKRLGWIDTPRTKAVYGFLGEAGTIALAGFEVEAKTAFATIAISSLTDDPIAASDTLLLTAVGQCDNTGATYDADRTRQLDRGHGPILIEPIEATIAVTTDRPHLKVWVIGDKGEAVTRLPTRYTDGILTFDIGAQPSWNPSTMYYLIKV